MLAGRLCYETLQSVDPDWFLSWSILTLDQKKRWECWAEFYDPEIIKKYPKLARRWLECVCWTLGGVK